MTYTMANPIFSQTKNITVKNSDPDISPQLRGTNTKIDSTQFDEPGMFDRLRQQKSSV